MEAVLGILTSSSLEVPLRKESRTAALPELPAAESVLLHTRQTKPMQERETSSTGAKKEGRAWEAASTAVDTLPLGEQRQSRCLLAERKTVIAGQEQRRLALCLNFETCCAAADGRLCKRQQRWTSCQSPARKLLQLPLRLHCKLKLL